MFVASQIKWRPCGPIRRLHLDKALTSEWIKGQNVIACTISLVGRDPSNHAREIRSLGILEPPPFHIEHKLFAGVAQGSIPMIALNLIKFTDELFEPPWALCFGGESRWRNKYRLFFFGRTAFGVERASISPCEDK
jgi:hypothetical protein